MPVPTIEPTREHRQREQTHRPLEAAALRRRPRASAVATMSSTDFVRNSWLRHGLGHRRLLDSAPLRSDARYRRPAGAPTGPRSRRPGGDRDRDRHRHHGRRRQRRRRRARHRPRAHPRRRSGRRARPPRVVAGASVPAGVDAEWDRYLDESSRAVVAATVERFAPRLEPLGAQTDLGRHRSSGTGLDELAVRRGAQLPRHRVRARRRARADPAAARPPSTCCTAPRCRSRSRPPATPTRAPERIGRLVVAIETTRHQAALRADRRRSRAALDARRSSS